FNNLGNCLRSGQAQNAPSYGISATGGPGSCTAGGPDCEGRDNLGFAYFVKDAKLDLTVDTATFCRSYTDWKNGIDETKDDVTADNCGTPDGNGQRLDDLSYPSSYAVYNSTRRPNDWPCDDAQLRQKDPQLNAACTG